ncbi:MAG: NrfD/PsrC family molybdoenzyme membrane anchor subunit, partial [bacterium]
DLSPEACKVDQTAIRVLAAIGIPAACILHGYVGFLFGALKSNPWWSTPLMPIIFLFSAVVSGIALLIVIYQSDRTMRGRHINQECIASLSRWLWLFMIVTVSLELLEIVTLAYEQSEEWEIIGTLLTTKLSFSFISVQMILGSLVPFILLMIVVLMNPYLHERVRNTLTFMAASILLLQVFAMRWNVVIGGQIFSKSLRGFRDYPLEFFGKEGILVGIIIIAIPFVILYVLNRIFPAFSEGDEEETRTGPAQVKA